MWVPYPSFWEQKIYAQLADTLPKVSIVCHVMYKRITKINLCLVAFARKLWNLCRVPKSICLSNMGPETTSVQSVNANLLLLHSWKNMSMHMWPWESLSVQFAKQDIKVWKGCVFIKRVMYLDFIDVESVHTKLKSLIHFMNMKGVIMGLQDTTVTTVHRCSSSGSCWKDILQNTSDIVTKMSEIVTETNDKVFLFLLDLDLAFHLDFLFSLFVHCLMYTVLWKKKLPECYSQFLFWSYAFLEPWVLLEQWWTNQSQDLIELLRWHPEAAIVIFWKSSLLSNQMVKLSQLNPLAFNRMHLEMTTWFSLSALIQQ